MQAAVINGHGQNPTYAHLPAPQAGKNEVLVNVGASAITNLVKMRASGQHYSANYSYPQVPGIDGIGTLNNGQRVYFSFPVGNHGTLAEQTVVDVNSILPVPDRLESSLAAALANPGMSSWAALQYRANLQPGETVLINGATGTAGELAIQIARYLGAGKIIATGRNITKLAEIADQVDATIALDLTNETQQQAFKTQLEPLAQEGIDVVLDYLWGDSALLIASTIAQYGPKTHNVRFVNIGSMTGQTIQLPASFLRSSTITIMGSGLSSVSNANILQSIAGVFKMVADEGTELSFVSFPLNKIEQAWDAPTNPRVVIEI